MMNAESVRKGSTEGATNKRSQRWKKSCFMFKRHLAEELDISCTWRLSRAVCCVCAVKIDSVLSLWCSVDTSSLQI